MRKLLTALILVPLGLVFIVFAVANRHGVTVSFDPFNARDPAAGITLPLFVVIIAVAMTGVAAGGIATWLTQRRWRKAARRHAAEAADLRVQLTELRSRSASPQPVSYRLPAPVVPFSGYGASERDKPRLTL